MSAAHIKLDKCIAALEEMARARAEEAYGGLDYQKVGEKEDYVEEYWSEYLTPTARSVMFDEDED